MREPASESCNTSRSTSSWIHDHGQFDIAFKHHDRFVHGILRCDVPDWVDAECARHDAVDP